MTRQKKLSVQNQQSQGSAKAQDPERVKETDVKHAKSAFGDDYKRMMGQHWTDIDKHISKESKDPREEI